MKISISLSFQLLFTQVEKIWNKMTSELWNNLKIINQSPSTRVVCFFLSVVRSRAYLYDAMKKWWVEAVRVAGKMIIRALCSSASRVRWWLCPMELPLKSCIKKKPTCIAGQHSITLSTNLTRSGNITHIHEL